MERHDRTQTIGRTLSPRILGRLFKALGVLGLTFGLLPAPAPAAWAGDANVQTTEGMVEGVTQNGITSFLGLPYAAPPVGDLRWRAPQPPSPHATRLIADHFGHDCMQNAMGRPGAQPVSEDCLYLNVWVRASPKARNLPVMVFVHGGGFSIGSGAESTYDGSSLAQRGVVLVTFNYRLGKFGFFAHPALTKENPDGPLGNYQVLDQIAALKWVRRNIASFGGNPDNITLFGESSGGVSVTFLMSSPLAKGLFAKAIIESGVRRFSMKPIDKAEMDGKAAAEKWGVRGDDVSALRRVPAKTILGKATLGSGGGGPMIDGKIIRETPMDAFESGNVVRVPLLIGTNSYEAGSFEGFTKGLAKRLAPQWPEVLTLYDGYGTHQTHLIEGELMTDILTAEPTREVARAAAAHGMPTYVYLYNYIRPSERGKVPGPVHTDELYAVFGTMKTVEPVETSDMRKITDEVQSRWVRFAKTGHPGERTSDWPALTKNRAPVLEFDQDRTVLREDLDKKRFEFVVTLPAVTPN